MLRNTMLATVASAALSGLVKAEDVPQGEMPVFIPTVADFQYHPGFVNSTDCADMATTCFSENAPVAIEMAEVETTKCPEIAESFELMASVLECMIESAPSCTVVNGTSFVSLLEDVSGVSDGYTCLKNGTIISECASECQIAVEEFEELDHLFPTVDVSNNTETVAPTEYNMTMEPTEYNMTMEPTEYNMTMEPTEYNMTMEPTVQVTTEEPTTLEEMCMYMAQDCLSAQQNVTVESMNINDNTCDEYLGQFYKYVPMLSCVVGEDMQNAGCLETPFVKNMTEMYRTMMINECTSSFNETVVETEVPITEVPTEQPETEAPTNETVVVIPPGGNGTVPVNGTTPSLVAAVENATEPAVNTTVAPTTVAPSTVAPTSAVCTDGCFEKVDMVFEMAKKAIEEPTEVPTEEPTNTLPTNGTGTLTPTTGAGVVNTFSLSAVLIVATSSLMLS